MVVVITSTGGVTKRVYAFDAPVDAGLANWAAQYLNEQLVGLDARQQPAPARGSTTRASTRASARSSRCSRRALHRGGRARSSGVYVGGAAGLLDDVRDRGARRVPSADRAARAPARAARRRSPRHSTRGGPSSASATSSRNPALRDLALVGAAYGIANRTLGAVSLIGPLRMDYEKAIRTVRSAAARALPVRRGDLRTTGLAHGDDRRARLLRAARRRAHASEAEIKKAFRRSRASCIPTSPTQPDAEERFREVVEAYEVLSDPETRASSTTASATRACAAGGFTPTSFDFGDLGDLFSAFFGDDLFGARGSAAPRCPRRGRRGGDRDRARRGGARDRRAMSRSRSPSPARRARAAAPSRAPSPSTCPTCGGSGPARSRSRTRSSASSCARRRARAAAAAGRVIEHPCKTCERRRARRRGARARRSRSRPASTTASGSGSAARAMRASSAAAGRRSLRAGASPARTRASCARATTSSRRST